MKEKFTYLENKLKIKFKNKSLLKNALIHKSHNAKFNNEKLEFLGDRVIGLVLSKKLFDLYPEEVEGILDKRLAKLVNKNTCSIIANSINLHKYIITGESHTNIKKSEKKIISDSCESLIGAIYLDKGYETVEKIVIRLWQKELDKSNITIVDPKTKLQEYSLKKFKKLPIYNIEYRKGPHHKPIFKISVIISNSKKFFGIGNSKKIAEQSAAKNLVKNLNL